MTNQLTLVRLLIPDTFVVQIGPKYCTIQQILQRTLFWTLSSVLHPHVFVQGLLRSKVVILPHVAVTHWHDVSELDSLFSSLCTTLKASRNSVKSILPSLLKSMLRARSSIALLLMSTPRWALKRRQVWRNSSMEIRPEHSSSNTTLSVYNVVHENFWADLTLLTWVVFVYDVKYYLNVCLVSEQSFSQVWSDLRGDRPLTSDLAKTLQRSTNSRISFRDSAI